MVAPVVVNSIDSAGLPKAVSPTDPMPATSVGVPGSVTQRTIAGLVAVRQRISFALVLKVKAIEVLALPFQSTAVPPDTCLLFTINAASTTAADQALNGGIIQTELEGVGNVFMLPLGQRTVVYFTDEFINNIDVISGRSGDGTSVVVPLAVTVGGVR